MNAPARCGIVLHPASHTRSPAMHRRAYEVLGIRARYEVFDTPPAALGAMIARARAEGFRQLAISIPHKQAVVAHLDCVEQTARRIGAVNTVTRVETKSGAKLVGANTDWIGLQRALARETSIQGRRAVVLGAGGTARAAAFALAQGGAQVQILNRNAARAAALAFELGGGIRGGGGLGALRELECDVLVNTTSVGLRSDESPVPAEALRALRPGAVVFDAVYAPEETRLLREARVRGARCISGKWMLIEQAREQLRLWTGRAPAAEVLAEAFDGAG